MPTVYDVIADLSTTMGASLATTNTNVSNLSTKPLVISPFTLSTLPDVAANSGKIINVTDATGGAKICQSDGTNWNLINTTTAVS